MNRKFLLPLSALALGVTGCPGDPDTGGDDPDTDTDTSVDTEAEPTIVGNWNGTSLTDYAGDVYSLPTMESYVEDGITYTEVQEIGLAITEGGATLTATYTYTEVDGAETSTEMETYTYSGTWSEVAAPVYRLDLEGESLDMDCTLSTNTLECVITEDEPDVMSITFARDVGAE